MSQIRRYQIALTATSLYSLFLSSLLFTQWRRSQPEPQTSVVSSELAQQLSGGMRRSQSMSAAPELTVWTDYQCPFCRRLEAALDSTRAVASGTVSVRIRHFPLRIHARAMELAQLSTCADRQGAFPRVHHALFERQSKLDSITLREILVGAQIDDQRSERILSCLSAGETRRHVESDMEAAKVLHLNGTPLILVGRTVVRGTLGALELDSLIRAALAGR